MQNCPLKRQCYDKSNAQYEIIYQKERRFVTNPYLKNHCVVVVVVAVVVVVFIDKLKCENGKKNVIRAPKVPFNFQFKIEKGKDINLCMESIIQAMNLLKNESCIFLHFLEI